jgi:enoyl-CoA hydratase/carnithine racemase
VADQVRIERDGAVASIVLSNPPLNLFGEEVFTGLVSCLDELEVADDVRCVLWRAEGDIFTGGVDVNVFQRLVDADEDGSRTFGQLLGPVRRLEALPMPTLALVHGLCLTAGWEVALGCDLIWASESAKAGLVETVVGLTPGAGGTQRMAERAGPGRAREFVYSGGLFDAATLERWNVVNRVLPDKELHEKGMRFAQKLADGPTKAHGATKAIVRGYLEGGVNRADEITPEVAGALFDTDDLKNAVASFLKDGPGKATFQGK